MFVLRKRNFVDYLIAAIIATVLFAGLKYRCIGRAVTGVSPYYSVWGYIVQDFLVWLILTFPLFFHNKLLRILSSLIFILFSANILFISKTGYPFSASLLTQAGDLMFIQTSISSPSVFRNLYILIGSTCIYAGFVAFITKFNMEKILRLVLISFIFLSVVSVSSYIFPRHNLIPRLASNVIVAIFNPPSTFQEILAKESFKHFKGSEWKRHTLNIKKKSRPKNIVLIIVETLKSGLPAETMPFLQKLSKQSKNFKNHHTSWPYSSKALFSVMCAQPPLPGNLIEMRLGMKFPCQNWLKFLQDNYKYRSYLGYTGDLRYDNMKTFFKQLGVNDLFDRHNLNKKKNYLASKLSIDDKSMVDKFNSWLNEQENPFTAIFITMNSHFPFWTPYKEFEYTEDPYLNSMRYQDEIIKSIYLSLQERGVLEETILVVTGDHGRREAGNQETLLPRSMFHIPLIIYDGGAAEEIAWPTNHYQIGSSLVKMATGSNFGYSELNLSSRAPVLSFFESTELSYTLLSEEMNIVFQGQEKVYLSKTNWPSSESDSCDLTSCRQYFEQFFNQLDNLRVIYEKK